MTSRARDDGVDLSDIGAGAERAASVSAPDDLYELEVDQVTLDRLKEENADLKANRELRMRFAKSVMVILAIYGLVVTIILFFAGFSLGAFTLPESVLVTLTGSTAVAVLGLVGFIVQGLFRSR